MTRYQRARGVLWRQTADRVLVRRVGDHRAGAEADVTGVAAVVWLLLERSLSRHDVCLSLTDVATDDPVAAGEEAIQVLLAHALICEATEPGADTATTWLPN